MKWFKNLRDGGVFAGYIAFLVTVVILGAHGLAAIFG